MKYADLKRELRAAGYWEELPNEIGSREHRWNRGLLQLTINATHAMIRGSVGVYCPRDSQHAAELLHSFEPATE